MLTINDFTGLIHIPDLYGDSASAESLRRSFNTVLSEYEEDFLRDLFGDDYYDDHSDDIQTGTAAEWVALRTRLTRPMARYVFFQFTKHNATATTQSGEVQVTFQGASIVVNKDKLIKQWNRMSDEVGRLIEWLEDNTATYTDFDSSASLLTSGVHPLNQIGYFQ